MAFQVERLLAHNAGRIAAMKEDLQKVTEVLAKAKPDNVEAQGFVQHLKLPHYVDFQSELVLIRALRREARERCEEAAE